MNPLAGGPLGSFWDMVTAPFVQVGGNSPMGWLGQGINTQGKEMVDPFSIASIPKAGQGAMKILQPAVSGLTGGRVNTQNMPNLDFTKMLMDMFLSKL